MSSFFTTKILSCIKNNSIMFVISDFIRSLALYGQNINPGSLASSYCFSSSIAWENELFAMSVITKSTQHSGCFFDSLTNFWITWPQYLEPSFPCGVYGLIVPLYQSSFDKRKLDSGFCFKQLIGGWQYHELI